MTNGLGYCPGIVQTALIDENHLVPEQAAFETVRDFKKQLPDHIHGLSFCREHNYWYDFKTEKIIKCDKDFKKLGSLNLPETNSVTKASKIWVSPDEKYLFVDYGKQCDISKTRVSEMKLIPSLSVLYDMKTLRPVKDFSYDYVSNFTMYGNDRHYIIGTWGGTFVGEIET